MRRLLFICIAALLAACRALADSSQCQSGSSRLPKRIKPTNYDVRLNLDWEKLRFQGSVTIDIEFDAKAAKSELVCDGTPSPSCDKEKIILHAGKELEIETVGLVAAKNRLSRTSAPETTPAANVNFCRDSSNDQLIVELDHALDSPGQLVLTYTGQLKKEGHKGFFLSEAYDSQGESTSLWVTSLEPGWARTVLPCFDEPDFKATFIVTIEHPQGLTALSNMHEIGRAESNGRTEVTFEQTPKMSTYLFAVAIGKMDHIETKPSNGKITFRAWAPPGRAEEARESLELIVKSYEDYVKYFNVEQPLKKIDFISVDSVGMGNWGLVTMHPFVLLDGAERRQHSFFLQSVHDAKSIILHEMAHFWFGNLVTVKGWDEFWLKEGFATFIAGTETNKKYPEFGGEHFDLIYEKSETLHMMTSSEYAHPVEQSALQSVDDIQDSLKVNIYNKVSAVLRMIKNFMGDDSFQTGVQNYIKKFEYKNAEARDLWDSLSKVSGKINVGAIINSWIQNEGFPLILTHYRKSKFLWIDRCMLKIEQRKFTRKDPYGNERRSNGNEELWQIPISLLVSNGKDKTETIQTLLTTREAEIALPSWFDAKEPGHLVKVNKDFGGLYRVFYNEAMLKAFKEPIENKNILSPADRVNLLDDYSALFFNGLVEEEKWREVTSWYKGEDHEAVLATLSLLMGKLLVKYQNPEGVDILKSYFHKNVELMLNVPEEDLFGKKESLLQTVVRVEVLYVLVRFEYQPAIDFSLEYIRSRQGKVAHHMMKPTYSAIGVAGTDEEYERMKRGIEELTGVPRQGLLQAVQCGNKVYYQLLNCALPHVRVYGKLCSK